MDDGAVKGIVGILTAVIGVAIVAALVGKNSQTSSVISSAGQAFSGILGTALSPVGGANSMVSNIGGYSSFLNNGIGGFGG